MLGDNLNDFRRYYYVTDRAERLRRMEEDTAKFGRNFILFPNPTDGHWVRAIFGTSEPAATPENRELLRNVAGR
jgi:predicted secreted acid phosphatase